LFEIFEAELDHGLDQQRQASGAIDEAIYEAG